MKKAFYDIIPNEKRSIRNIPITKKTDAIFETTLRATSDEETHEMHSKKHGAYSAHHANHNNETERINKTDADNKIHHTVHTRQTMDGIRSKGNSLNANSSNDVTARKYEISQADTKSRVPYVEIEPEIVDEDLEEKENIEENRIIKNKAFYKDTAVDKDGNFDEVESFEEWRSTKKNSFWRAWVALGVLAVASVVIFSIYFASATIIINPIKHDLVLKDSTIFLTSIKHEEMSTDITKSKEISANGTLKVDRKATGKIVLYNAYNSSPQKLVAGTRLQTPNGLIYKLKNPVTIPAQKTVSGKKVPGSVEAEVEASESGEKYNQGFKDFNIVAYQGSDRYDSIYGRSKTSLANGFSGTVPNIATKDVNAAVDSIKSDITKDADIYFAKKAKSKGEEFEYIPSTKQFTYGETKQDVSKDGKTATITIAAKVNTMLFDSTSLFEQIIKMQADENVATSTDDTTTDITDEIVYTGDLTKLNVTLNKDGDKVLVSGTTTISSAIDVPKVTKAVSGLEKEQAIGAIKRLVELETIAIDIRPWWNKKLPSSDRISIKTEE